MIAGLLRHDKKDPKDFFVAYDRLLDYVENTDHYGQIVSELGSRNVNKI